MARVQTHPEASSMARHSDHDLLQLEKIVHLHDSIISGSHPTIKVPAYLAGQLTSLAGLDVSSSQTPTFPSTSARVGQDASQDRQVDNVSSFEANSRTPTVPGLALATSAAAAAAASGYAPGGSVSGQAATPSSQKTAINPIFLEKSDDLIRAELQLQRQRLERALREELDAQRTTQKKTAQAEPLPDFDLHDVLSKALTLVEATASSSSFPPNEVGSAANDAAAASDSFDENSYYSSQHYSPDSSHPSPDTAARPPATHQQQAHDTNPSHASHTGRSQPIPTVTIPPPAATRPDDHTTGESKSWGERSGEGSGSDSLLQQDRSGGGAAASYGAYNAPASHARSSGSAFARPPSPLVVAQDLAPVAPQPSRVSPLAAAVAGSHQTPAYQPAPAPVYQGTAAQVTALRNEPNAVSSPDSSPQGGRSKNDNKKPSNKKKGKKDKPAKKGAARQAQSDIPYIKEEPRSPSPMGAPPMTRPQKRQKRQAEADNVGYAQDRPVSRIVREDHYASGPAPTSYGVPNDYLARPVSRVASATGYAYGYGPEYVEDRRPLASAQPYAASYRNPEVYDLTTAAPSAPPTSQNMYDREPQRIYRETYDAGRMSARPDHVHREPVHRPRSRSPMGPPRAAPAQRILVDAHGRQYYEPLAPSQPPIPAPQSVPPIPRAEDAGIVYGNYPRAESRRPEYYDGGVIYRRTSPNYAPQRRVVTQPEYAVSDPHRAYREREYSTQPAAAPPPPPPAFDPYGQPRAAHERRPIEEAPRDYAMRATTARPADPVRYELPRQYERMQSMRPDLPAHGYPAGSHTEVRREMAQPTSRSYSVRPPEPPVVRREVSTRLPEHYYTQQPVRAEEHIAYVEHPREAPQDMMYYDPDRR